MQEMPQAASLRASAPVRKCLEPEAVRQFVRRDGNKIDIVAVIIVQPEVEMHARETASIPKVHVESRPDFGR